MATEYKVLRRTSDGNYQPAGVVESHSPIAAAKAVDQEQGYDYLAVPTANAHFVSLGIEQPPPKVVAKVMDGPDFPLVGQATLPTEPDQTGPRNETEPVVA